MHTPSTVQQLVEGDEIQADRTFDQRTSCKDDDMMIPNTLGSAFAGIISRTFTHPLDTAKARLQATSLSSASLITNTNNILQQPIQNIPHYKGPMDVILRTMRNEGIRGLYRGFGVVIVGGTPGTVCYLCTYEYCKQNLISSSNGLSHQNSGSGNDFIAHFTAGIIAETVACIIYVPVDVIKERMQVQQFQKTSPKGMQTTYYKNALDAIIQISKTEGLRGIYKGYAATLASFGPFSALYFTFYEQMKHWSRLYIERKNNGVAVLADLSSSSSLALEKEIDLPLYLILLCSCGAGGLASWLTSPLDMAKLRLQVQRGARATMMTTSPTTTSTGSASLRYFGMLHCLQETYRCEGIRGLFRGAGARVLHFTPATTITITLYETCRSFIRKSFLDN